MPSEPSGCYYYVCREKHRDVYDLITRTRAKDDYVLDDSQLDIPPLRSIAKRNPHNPRWGDMRLYLRVQVCTLPSNLL